MFYLKSLKQKNLLKKEENTKKFKLFQRREEFASLYYQGFELSEIVNNVSKKYKVKKPTLIKDWERKNLWLSNLFYCSKKDKEKELLMKLHAVEKAAWQTYRKASNAGNFNAAVGALGKLMDIINREADFVKNTQDIEKIKDPFMLETSLENKSVTQ